MSIFPQTPWLRISLVTLQTKFQPLQPWSLLDAFPSLLIFAHAVGGWLKQRRMKKQKSIYKGNKKFMDDEETYPDKNTVVLIDLIVDIIVKKKLKQPEPMEATRIKAQLTQKASNE